MVYYPQFIVVPEPDRDRIETNQDMTDRLGCTGRDIEQLHPVVRGMRHGQQITRRVYIQRVDRMVLPIGIRQVRCIC